MKNKEIADKMINAVAVMAIAAFLIGAMVAIWIGFIGVKILLSAVVVFMGDYAVFKWTETQKRRRRKKWHRRSE